MKTLIILISVLSMAISSSCLYITWELSTWTVNYDSYCKQSDDTHEQQQLSMELQSALCNDVNDSVQRLDPLEDKVSNVEERLNNLQSQMMGAFDLLVSFQERLDGIDEAIAYLLENIPEKNK
jgi:hypothetical protein